MKPGASAQERTAYGKSRRDSVSRAAHADLHPKDRRFDPTDVLRETEEGRVTELLPVRYERMKASPFAFFRGAAAIMAADLGRLPNSGLLAQLCGDAHVQNLGSFATPDGKLVFDLNDFDETIRGPFEWDLKRMAASIVLAGRESGHGRAGSKGAAQAFAARYCRAIGEFSRQPILEVAHTPSTARNASSPSMPHCGSPSARIRATCFRNARNPTTAGSRVFAMRNRFCGDSGNQGPADSGLARRISRESRSRPAPSLRSLPCRRCRLQSGGDRKRGTARLRGPVPGQWLRRSHVPADRQGAVGLCEIPAGTDVPPSGAAHGGGPTSHPADVGSSFGVDHYRPGAIPGPATERP